jgi:hypothetical protein
MATAALDLPIETSQIEIVIPVFNEEQGLEAGVRRLHSNLRDRFPF